VKKKEWVYIRGEKISEYDWCRFRVISFAERTEIFGNEGEGALLGKRVETGLVAGGKMSESMAFHT
jgi:hypothetical protein